MPNAERLYKDYFLEYASYVIKDRAIPDLVDGFKPVQRRIIHAMLSSDDGRFSKVAGIIGDTMKYHPHGDASIGGALVNLVTNGLLIEGQGNYGNIFTGDEAAAPRYIEARLKPIAKKILYSPEITEFVDSYDGRNKEPVRYEAKLPIVVIQGTQGIAVGMSTRIFPHNLVEVLDAMKKALRGESFTIYPDFPTGGIMDVSQYDDGRGKLIVRAKLNASDPKKIIIEELPVDTTSSALIESIEKANKTGKLKIASINDYTAGEVNIEVNWQRGTYSEDMVDVLYATTGCQVSISANPLVLVDRLPRRMGISEIIKFHAEHLIETLRRELELEIGHHEEKLRARTMERIFIEERIYKKIETKKTQEEIDKAIRSGFKPFVETELGGQALTDDDIQRLLKIPIRRISLFDIEKNRKEISDIEADIAKCKLNLENIVDYSVSFIDDIESDLDKKEYKRKTKIASLQTLTAKDVAVRNMDLRYDPETGYLGTSVKTGEALLKVSSFDKVFYMKNDGEFRVVNVADRIFIGKQGIFYINYGEKDIIGKEIFTIIYKDRIRDKSVYMIKRFQINAWSTDKSYYAVTGEKVRIKKISLFPNARIFLKYKPGLGYRILEEEFRFADFDISKSEKPKGRQLTSKELSGLSIRATKEVITSDELQPTLFDKEK